MRKTTIAALTAVVGALMFSLMLMPLFSATGAAAAPALQTTATELATSAAVATEAATSAAVATEAPTAMAAATEAPTAMAAATSAPAATVAATTTTAATATTAPSTLPNTGGDSGASTLMLGAAALIIIGVAVALLMGRRRSVGM